MKMNAARCWCGAALLSAAVLLARAQDAPSAAPSTGLLTNIHQVVALDTNALDAVRHQARVRGVLIYVSPPTRRLYLQDGQEAIQANLTASVRDFRPGQVVEVTGQVAGGLPFPRIIGATAKVLGTSPLPEAKPSSAHRLATGQDAFRLVSVRAIVRDMTSDRSGLLLRLTEEWRAFELLVPVGNAALPRDWIDAEIEVQGTAYPFYNARNQPAGFRLHAPSLDFIRVVRPGVGSLFDRPVMTIAEASRQPWDWQRRLKIAGTVTAQQPVDILFVDDGTGPMQVNLSFPLASPEGGASLEHDAPAWLEPGDRVEVIGVRRNWSSLTPTLIHAEVRRIGKAPPVAPLPVSIADLQAGRYSGRVVSVAARLLDQRLWSIGNVRHQLLVLQAGDQIFQATWESEKPAAWDLQPGSYLRVTGVNDTMQGRFKGARLFQILLRSPEDIAPAPEPPFWTRPEIRRVGLGAGTVGLFAGAWILLQRHHLRRLERRVAERTSELRGEVAAREQAQEELRVALAAEIELNQLKSSFVSMVSHEFRTPLEVILSSSNILDRYFDRLPPAKRETQLRAIRKNVHRMNDLIEDVLMLSRLEAGRRECRPVSMNLESFCRQIVGEVESASNASGRVHLITRDLLEESAADEMLLQHILTNLLKNALKYSPADTPVDFEITRRTGDAEFVIRDRGCGIPEADRTRLFTSFHRGSNVGQTPGTGLGLVIVKRCVEAYGGALHFDSVEGEGTTFTVTLPLFNGAASPPAANGPPQTVSASSPGSHEDHSHH